MQAALNRHDAILRESIEANQGQVFRTMGDAFCAAFAVASNGLEAVIQAQQQLYSENWETEAPIRVRIVLHTGPAELRGEDYSSPTLNWLGRLIAVCNGGQTLLTLATAEQVRGRLPPNVTLTDLGQHRFRDLSQAERLYQVNMAGLPTAFPALKSIDAFPNNLPVQLTSFVGREHEIEEINALLQKTRLLTLTGPGGTGKTRLSLQSAAQALESFPDGAWLVELASLADPGLIVQNIASVFHVHEQHERPLLEIVVDWLKPRNLLIILDNCEHLIETCARTTDALLRACPDVKTMVSSREPLGIAGEVVFRVPSLSMPEDARSLDLEQIGKFESVRLFVERASEVKPSFRLTSQNAQAVVKICQRLDGIPLAIELAAARMNLLSAEQVAARLNDRFRLLTGGSRTALPRQQTLRALIDWSYELLSEPEQHLLRHLSVFAGSWTLEAGEAVYGAGVEGGAQGGDHDGGDVLDLLGQLVNKSLVLTYDRDDETRFRMLETIRQYARDKLLESGESSEARDLHLDFYFHLASLAYKVIGQPEEIAWTKRVDTEYDNMRLALEWALDKDGEIALQLAGLLAPYGNRLGYSVENRRRLLQALELVETQPPDRGETARRQALAIGLQGLGIVETVLGNNTAAAQAFEKSGDLWRQIGDPGSLARVLSLLSLTLGLSGHFQQAYTVAEESITISQQIKDVFSLALAQATQARGLLEQRKYSLAKEKLEQSIQVLKHRGHTWYLGVATVSLGICCFHQGQFEEAQKYYDEGEQIFHELGERHFLNVIRSSRAEMAYARGDYPAADQLYEETIQTWQKLGNRGAVARCLECLAFIAGKEAESQDGVPEARLDLLRKAGTLLGAAGAVRQESQSGMTPEEQVEYDQELAKFKSLSDVDVFEAGCVQGSGMSLEEAISYSLEISRRVEHGERSNTKVP